MVKALLSVKPEFAESIFKGIKKYEFRKTIFRSFKVETVMVYVTAPIQRIIGEFDIETILRDTPERLWEETHEHAGITKGFFFDYFSQSQAAFAIKIRNVRSYTNTLCLKTEYDIKPPQSFRYIFNDKVN